MSVKLQAVLEALEALAPRRLAEEWDNVGLQLGQPAQPVERVLVALDVSAAVVAEAREKKADLIVAHHPFLFKPLRQIRTDLPQGKLVQALLQDNIAVYAAHTNLDRAPGGLNDWLAEALGLQQVEVLQPGPADALVKLVTFVPQEQAEQVRQALGDAGAGHIGQYSHCSFQTTGEGAFLPLAGTRPFLGKPGKLERVAEVRLETILPRRFANRVVRALLRSHPYEEVAYDLYPLLNERPEGGLGRLGLLQAEISLAQLAEQVAAALEIPGLRQVGDGARRVRKVAVCGGAGAGLVSRAAFCGADVLVTGDVKYHEAQEAQNSGLGLLDAGHFATERLMVGKVAAYLRQQSQRGRWSLDVLAATGERDVFSWQGGR